MRRRIAAKPRHEQFRSDSATGFLSIGVGLIVSRWRRHYHSRITSTKPDYFNQRSMWHFRRKKKWLEFNTLNEGRIALLCGTRSTLRKSRTPPSTCRCGITLFFKARPDATAVKKLDVSAASRKGDWSKVSHVINQEGFTLKPHRRLSDTSAESNRILNRLLLQAPISSIGLQSSMPDASDAPRIH